MLCSGMLAWVCSPDGTGRGDKSIAESTLGFVTFKGQVRTDRESLFDER